MKSILLAASAVVLLSATPGVYAQSSGPTYDNSIHQSAGDRDSRGYPKYNQEGRGAVRATRRHREMGSSRMNRSATTGAGPYYENSIHQSAGDRDSRGYPKYYKGD